jgi:hypothetical protein
VRQRLSWIAVGVALAAGAGCSGPPDPLPNVRLGMAPRDVRDRFKPGGEGQWQTAVGSGDDTAVEWTSRDPRSTVAEARFEFHLGMLVAIRARTREPAAGERIATTAKTVTVQGPAEAGGTRITVLARDCPTHRGEAETFAAKAR